MSELSPTNPDSYCLELLASGGPRELREWLTAVPQGTLGVLQSHAEAVRFADQLYGLGAPHAYAVRIRTYADGMQNTGELVVELPRGQPARQQVLDWSAALAQALGFEGCADLGQQYVYVLLD